MSNKHVRKLRARYVVQGTAATTAGRFDADAIVREMAALDADGDGLTAEAVVAAAADEASAMHGCFDWSDDVAASRWRLHQARNLIRAVKVVQADGTTRSVYVHVGATHAYHPMTRIVERPDLYALAIAESRRCLELAARSLRELQELGTKRTDAEDVVPRIALAMKSLDTAREIAATLH